MARQKETETAEEPTAKPQAVLSEEQLALLKADKWLVIKEM